MASSPAQEDPFDTLLTLEDTLYTTAYTLGATSGAQAGRIEGRIFGLEKGFEKFASLGQLHGRSVVWGSRLPSLTSTGEKSTLQLSTTTSTELSKNATSTPGAEGREMKGLSPLSKSSRLKSNITLLHALSDPETFSTANTEESVADFDDRFKRAGAKAKVIERIVGESDSLSSKSREGSPARGKTGPVRVSGEGRKKGGVKGDDNFEDFLGGKGVR